MFNPDHFIKHIRTYLRGLGVDMTHTSGEADTVERCEGNPAECYKVVVYCYTPDYPKRGDTQPAYTLKGYAYPNEQKFYLEANEGRGDWNETLWPSLYGRTPADSVIRNEGLVDHEGNDWEVEVI